MSIPPKPQARPERVTLWRYLRLFRQDILSAQPAKLYHAWMAEFRTPFFRSYLINDPALIDLVLKERPGDFPKSDRIGAGLEPLLGRSVFLTNGEEWKRQRRIIDPAFAGGRLRDTYPAMLSAGDAAVERLARHADCDPVEMEEFASHLAADVIFRTLFSIPIEDRLATEVFEAFQSYQRTQPLLNLAAFIPVPRWVPRLRKPATRRAARRIRRLIGELTSHRLSQIAAGTAPDDLATKILTTVDPVTGQRFDHDEMVDQVAIFFLAGHETSAAALSWALYLLATHPEWQDRVADEATALTEDFGSLSQLGQTRDVFRETLRLYPPVPMMVREAAQPEVLRKRQVRPGAQIVISPWHLHRHDRLWENPDGFDPSRWRGTNGPQQGQRAYLPFSAGPRVCTGAGFAMAEGVALLSRLVGAFSFAPDQSRVPVPVAHLTVRSRDGIWLRIKSRSGAVSD